MSLLTLGMMGIGPFKQLKPRRPPPWWIVVLMLTFIGFCSFVVWHFGH